jgi:hypothetical protein
MWDPEHFPGADNVPWQLLIRARYQFEVDALVASVIVRNIAVLGTTAIAEQLGAAAAKSVAQSRELNGRKKVVKGGAAYALVAEFDDWCGTHWPRWPWPWPGPGPRFDVLDPIVIVLADRALGVLEAVGSPQLQEGLGGQLTGLAAGQF